MTENANEAKESFEIPQDMKIYYLRLLKRGPLWTPEETPEIERLQAAHLAHGRKLHEAGKLILNGPLLDNGDLRGVGIFRVGSLKEAQTLSDADPSVQAGRLVSEIHPWMIHRGGLARINRGVTICLSMMITMPSFPIHSPRRSSS